MDEHIDTKNKKKDAGARLNRQACRELLQRLVEGQVQPRQVETLG